MLLLTEKNKKQQTAVLLPQGMCSRDIITALREIEQQLKENEARFNEIVDGDLMEACIYDGKALRSRYRYYHNLARRCGIRWE